jgi:hypothetical protein
MCRAKVVSDKKNINIVIFIRMIMKREIRKIVRKEVDEIVESAGKQDDLHNSTERITNIIVEFLSKHIEAYKNDLFDGYAWEFAIPEIPTKEIQEKTLIGRIKTSVEYIHSQENRIGGAFKRVKLMDDGFYFVFLEIKININDNIEGHFNEIEYWVSHELHHAFRTIKTINKKSKANRLNAVKNKIPNLTADFLNKNPSLKEFVEMIYLSLPQEVDARKQEVATQLKYDKSTSPNQTYEYLMQFQPIVDARKMLNYSTEGVLKVDKDILRRFIDIFNASLKEKELNTWEKKDMGIFFEFWRKRIISAGGELKRDIDRKISDKYLYKSVSELFDYADLDIIDEAYGLDFGDILR